MPDTVLSKKLFSEEQEKFHGVNSVAKRDNK